MKPSAHRTLSAPGALLELDAPAGAAGTLLPATTTRARLALHSASCSGEAGGGHGSGRGRGLVETLTRQTHLTGADVAQHEVHEQLRRHAAPAGVALQGQPGHQQQELVCSVGQRGRGRSGKGGARE